MVSVRLTKIKNEFNFSDNLNIKMERKMKYSKFKSLTYEEHDDFEEFWKKNKFIKDIFEDSWLFSQNYKHFNDIDECVYLVNSSIKKTLTDKIYDKSKSM